MTRPSGGHYCGPVLVEPPVTPWDFPDPTGVPDDLIAFGADLAPGTLLLAYRSGYFPMPIDDDLGWWSPQRRGVLPLEGLRLTRSLRRSCRRFEIRIDTAFEEVIDACADPARDGGWIDEGIRAAYVELHRLGWAHSVEAWQDGALVGGLYGVATGGLFAGESMFHRVTDASKVALVALVDLLDDGRAGRLVDVQWRTDHLASLGVVEIDRAEYLERLRVAVPMSLPDVFEASQDVD